MAYTKKQYKKICEVMRASITDGDSVAYAYTLAGISKATHNRWRKERPDYIEMIDQAKEDFRLHKASLLVRSLIKRATGFEAPDVRTEYGVGANGQPIITKQIKTMKTVPPDTAALIFALTNLAPEEWQNTQRTNIATDDSLTGIRVEVVSKEQNSTNETNEKSLTRKSEKSDQKS